MIISVLRKSSIQKSSDPCALNMSPLHCFRLRCQSFPLHLRRVHLLDETHGWSPMCRPTVWTHGTWMEVPLQHPPRSTQRYRPKKQSNIIRESLSSSRYPRTRCGGIYIYIYIYIYIKYIIYIYIYIK